MNRPSPLHAVPNGPETTAARAQRLAAQATSAAAETVHDMIVALSAVRTEAEVVAALESVPAGQREIARQAAEWARGQIDSLNALIARA